MLDVQPVYTPSQNSGLIPGGQNSSRERQTVFLTAVNPMDKEHKDPYKLDLAQPRLAWHKQKTWKRQQDTVYWVHIQLAQRKGLKFHQTRCNAIIFYDTLPAYCIPYQDENWRNHIRESICVTPAGSTDFISKPLDEGIGFRSCWTWRKLPTDPTKDHKSNC